MTHLTVDAARAAGGPGWLQDRRLAAAERLAELAWPTSAEEIWRYSRVDDLDLDRYRPLAAADTPRPDDAGGFEIGERLAAEAGARAGVVLVRDGAVVHHELDPMLEAKGVRLGALSSVEDGVAAAMLGQCSDASPDAFTVLHDAFLRDAAYLHVPAGVVIDRPVVVVHRSEAQGALSCPHTLVVADEAAEVTVVERSGGTVADSERLVDAVVELVLGDGAHVRHVAVQEHGPRTWQIALQRAHVGRDATLRSAAVALGGEYARLRSETLLAGSGGESDLLAVYFGDEAQVLDFRTLQDHDAPYTRSDLLFKGAVEDEAHSVYSGLVRLRPSAQHANANQSNRNLVLTEGAGAESIPNLEIEANDVRCSHASAVGPIDDDQRYYLESRGIPPGEAERLIVLGFFDDVLSRLGVAPLVDPLRRRVIEKIEHARSGEAAT